MSRYDSLVAEQKYKEAIPFLRRIRDSIGGDPYLHYAEGVLLRVTGDREAAKKALRRCIDGDPLIIGPYQQLLTIALAEEDHDMTKTLLEILEEDLQVELNDITKIPAYAGFVASSQYQEWKKRGTEEANAEPPEDR